ncbi:MAG: hypothetical protein HYX68_13185 [Planctomycetes bacterium]|jgi:hypothetical protein|nr:hypothetical protein [Planctomycetota bacterium]
MTTITLPPEIEIPLAEAACEQGITPEQLALQTLRTSFAPKANGAPPEKPAETLYDFLKGYVGTLSGSGESFSENCGERFTDYLVEKKKAGRL